MAVSHASVAEDSRLIIDGTFFVVISPVAYRNILATVASVRVIHDSYLFFICDLGHSLPCPRPCWLLVLGQEILLASLAVGQFVIV